MARDPYKYFRVEARDIVADLGKGVLELERPSPAPELMPRLLRLTHTLKGAARVVRQREIADLAHAIEDALAPYREGGAAPRDRIDGVLAQLDAIGALVGRLDAPEEAAPPQAPEEPLQTLRADVREMDALLADVTVAQVQLMALRRGAGSLERLDRLAALLVDQVASPRAHDGAAARLRALVEELPGLVAGLGRDLAAGIDRVDRELRGVRESAERLRLVPTRAVFDALERSARDAARSVGRSVSFAAAGGDVRLDAHVLGAVQGALVQAVRNAVAHGIEPEAERVAAGKAAEGSVRIEVSRRGGRAVFRCRDDGRGVDLEAVRRLATRRGVAPAEASKLDAEQLVSLLLRGGISTSGAVTEAAGRGVGLDVVRSVAERLGGEVTVRTEPGAGTTLELTVPVFMASLEALVVEAGGRTAAIPVDAVRRVLRVEPGDVARSADGASLLVDGRIVPFAPLARALGVRDGDDGSARGARSAVVVEGGGGALAAVGVDRLLGTETAVFRPLPRLALADPVAAGASLDAEGNPRVVIDPERLVAAVHGGAAPRPPSARPRQAILVVDDSLTTRMLEQAILESAGYEVEAAASAEEAIEKSRGRRFALALVDVEMPGMDGFTFVERARDDPALRDVPMILVTSRASPDDRRRGEAAGARAYIVKSEFDQAELLARIRTLVS